MTAPATRDSDGALLIHVINLHEANSSGLASERLPSIHGLQLRIQGRGDAGFAAVLHPHGEAQSPRHVDGRWVVDLPPLQSHLCLEIHRATP